MALAAAPDIPGFSALSQLGAGPSSSIFSAQSVDLGRWVALTVYSSTGRSTGKTGAAADEFRRGFELTRRLGVHPHAVTLLDWGTAPDGRPYIVTEFYEHGTFDTRVSGNQPLPVDKTLRIGIQVAGALETAHRAGVIHGGVHPARILADSDDEPSLADMGLVSLVDPTGPDALLGPLNHHAPPEVLEGDERSPATDVYSLASTLHTLLTCQPPYRVETDDAAAALLLRILRQEHAPLTRADAPPSLAQTLRAALHPDPRQRPASVLAFAQTLQEIQNEIGVPRTQPVLLDVARELAGADEPSRSAPSLPPNVAPTAPPAPPAGLSAAAPPWARLPTPPPETTSAVGLPPDSQTRPAPVRGQQQPERPSGQPARAAPPAPSASPSDDKAFVPYPMPETEPPVGETGHPATDAPPSPAQPAVPTSPTSPAAPPTTVPPAAIAHPAIAERVEPHEMQASARTQSSESPAASTRTRLVARGPKALPVIVLAIIVGILIVGATWMVISGSDPSDATTDSDPVEEQSG